MALDESPISAQARRFWSFGRKKQRTVDPSLTEPILPRDDEPSKLSESNDDRVEDSVPKGFRSAGCFSLVFLQWVGPLIRKGLQRPLQMPDIPPLGEIDDADLNFLLFEASWKKEQDLTPPGGGELPSLERALWRCYWRPFMWCIVVLLLWVATFCLGPVILFLLITYLNSGQRDLKYGVALAVTLLIGRCSEPLCKFSAVFWTQKLGVRMWAAVGSAVYRKTLLLSNRVRQERTVGEITNIMSNDLYRFLTLIWNVQQALVLPIRIAVATAFLYLVVGLSAVAGLLSLIAVMSGNVLLVSLMRKYRAGLLKVKDERMRVTVECFGNMKVVKLQAWDDVYRKRIEALRAVERNWVAKFNYAWAVSIFVIWAAPLAVSAVTFVSMAFLGESLTPAKVFTAMTTFNLIKEPLQTFPDVVSNIIQGGVSIHRMRDFLCEEQVGEHEVVRVRDPGCEYAVEFDNASFTWDTESEGNNGATIRNVNLKVRKGSCVAVCGVVGSGKSSLLFSVLGELKRLEGSATVCGRVAYVAQSAWIQTKSIKDNILFGQAMDSHRYHESLRVSGLETDLAQFPAGDETEIGEKGVNMSGGQKQRIQLARAVYAEADVYLLDDPFSAVDAHTASHLFKECVRGALKDKTVILVSHQVEFLAETDEILVMRDGEIVQSGPYHDLVAEGKDFGSFIEALQHSLNSVVTHTATAASASKSAPESAKFLEQVQPLDINAGNKEKFIKAEERETGIVKFSVLLNYATKVYKGLFLTIIVVVNIMTFALQVSGDSWMATRSSLLAGKKDDLWTVEIYTVLVTGSMLSVLLRSVSVAFVGTATAQAFFLGMLHSLLRAPMSFMDSTPLGRILSRSSTDQTALELDLPNACANAAFNMVAALCTTAVICYVTPMMLIFILPIAYFFILIQRYFVTISRDLSRLNAIAEAPMYLHMSESVAGVSTIRAWEDQPRFVHIMSKRFDHYQRCFFHLTATTSWFAMRHLSLVGIIAFGVGLTLVLLPEGTISPGMAGLSLTYAFGFSNVLSLFTVNATNVENKMVSVERIDQYSHLPSEAPLVIPDKSPPKDWPDEGKIELKNLQLRYRPTSPLVLKGISCTIQPQEKVGVVGRTGSGKSTLIQALFRLVEPCEGSIIIDGVDIGTIGLTDLRARLSVIPQEPTIFEGTVRTNLDPFDQHTDHEVWESLESCMIADAVKEKPEKLNSLVTSQGENWSVGERQLLCLARAVLKKARILVLDEASASLDITTDAIIQKAIRRQFAHCTVINVAHRIPTVIDSDRVLVFDAGHLKENDSPQNLLSNENSLFSKLVQEYTSRSGSQ
ncbi:unnamed protein product [Calypogeia fissa]